MHVRRSPFDALLPWALISLVVLALGLVGYGWLYFLKGLGGVFQQAWSILVLLPPSFSKTMSILVVLLVLAAGALAPFAWWETRSARAFARREEEIRRERPDDVVTPYAGMDGDGVVFESPSGERLFLLHPEAGVGEPRVVVMPAPAPEMTGEPAS